MVPIALLLTFFYGLVLYPLTDLYAALLCITAGWFIYFALQNESLHKAGLMYFFAGICIYGAYNIRTIYLLSIYCLFLVIAFMERKKVKNVILALFSFALGIFVCAIPQIIINFQRYEIISPWINNQNLFARQLFWGLQSLKYGTYVGSEIPDLAGMYYTDPIGKQIVDTFVLKTIKRFEESEGPAQQLLPEYKDLDDMDYARKLLRSTIANAEEYRSLLGGSAKNWEMSRFAFMDVVIMQTALAELLTFDDIPASVTLNEYVEIAKYYSTPKSSSFVNGMLDNIVKKLRAEGRIE